MAKEKFVTGIDIGASKICCLVGARKPPGIFNVLGCGVVHHNCIRKGVVVNLKGLSDAISKAVYKAEQESDKKAHSVYINISGPHIEGLLSHGEMIISDRDSEITRYDAEKVTDNAKSINIPYEREIFYTVHYGYTVDGEKGIIDPQGMFGLKLTADLYLITVKAAFIENLKKAVRGASVGVAGVVISTIPTSLALLSEHEKQIGTTLIDIGKDLAEISIYSEGLLRYIKVIPIGGEYVTTQISHKLRIPFDTAEKLKIENATLDGRFSKGDKLILKVDSHKRVIYKKDLQDILKDAYKKIFIDLKEEIHKGKIFRDAANGVVLTGAPSYMEGAAEKAEIEFGCPVKVGHVKELGHCPKPLPSHIFATAVGLIKYGFKDIERKRGFLDRGAKNIFSSLLSYTRSLYREYF
ncbi:MAG: cell division protein FtsA [Candidatus Omnitrophota bacterium]|nr:MAG: cell division protein FtsA [Candidatus Omnitrophota bacterium]